MKTKKNTLIVLIAVAISSVSCVDNLVSPQVEAIREQQVEWMKAKTASELALGEMTKATIAFNAATIANQTALNNANIASQAAATANQNAVTAGLVISNAYAQSLNALLLKNKELDYNLAVASNALALKNAEVSLAIANLNLEKALNDLKLAVAKSGDDLAQEYYTNYSAKANELSNLYNIRLGKQSEIARSKLLLSEETGILNNFLKLKQITIDADNLLLTSQKVALATLKAVITDPTSLQTEINTLNSTNIALNASKDKLNNDLVKANSNKEVALKVYTDGQAIISKMSVYKNDLNTVNLNITNQDKSILDKETLLSDAKSVFISKTLGLTNAKAIYAQEKANFDVKVSLYNAALAIRVEKKSALDIKLNATSIAYSNWDKVTADANKIIWQNAKILSDAAQLAYNTALTNSNSATTAMNNASVPYQKAKTAVSNAENDINTAQNNITSAEAALLTAKNNKSTNALEKTRLEKAIADLTTSFNTESTKQFQYFQNYESLNEVVTDLNKKVTAIGITVNQNNNVIKSLTISKTNIENLKAEAAAQSVSIAATEKTIADNTELLKTSTAANAKAATEANIAKLTKDLDALNIQITAAEKLAAYWKGLLDKIFTV